LQPGRSQVNLLSSRKREHSRKPDEFYNLIEDCSPGPYLELFAREKRPGWTQWGDQIDTYHETKRVAPGYRGGDVEAA
jgi:N6-adenosine-specific RNA methylase IME4